MTISKDVFLSRYTGCLSDMFPKRRIRDSSLFGYVFVDDSIASRLKNTVEIISKVLERFFPSVIDIRSLKYVGTVIEKICAENSGDFLPQEKIALSYQQFLQTLGSIQYFSFDFFPLLTRVDLDAAKDSGLFLRQKHLPIGVVIALKKDLELRQFRVFSWKLNFKHKLDESGSLIQPYLRRQILSGKFNEMAGKESAESARVWSSYKKVFNCIEKILIEEGVEFFLLQGVDVDFQVFLKETIRGSDLHKICDVCFFKNGVSSQILIYRKTPIMRLHAIECSKPEDRTKKAEGLISSSLQISEVQLFTGSWFFLNVDIDDLDFNEAAKGMNDLMENIETILKERAGKAVFFLIGGSIKSAENIEKIFQDNQSLRAFRLKPSYFTEMRLFLKEGFLKRKFLTNDEFILVLQESKQPEIGSLGVDCLDMESVIEGVQDQGLSFFMPLSQKRKTSALINI